LFDWGWVYGGEARTIEAWFLPKTVSQVRALSFRYSTQGRIGLDESTGFHKRVVANISSSVEPLDMSENPK
jgi:hypothetical protein